MKIKSGMPTVGLTVKQVTFPWQEKPSDLEFNIGSIEIEIEGDAKELVLHSTSFFTNIKDIVDYIREIVHEEEDLASAKREAFEEKVNKHQKEIDAAVGKVDSEYRSRIDGYDEKIVELCDCNTELRTDYSNVVGELEEVRRQAALDVVAAFRRGLSSAEPLKAAFCSPPSPVE
jgi:hypothetical protein